ncbi:MAG: hypothetical protein ACT4OX_01700 [Actinomycetota bacterium]
MPRRDLHRLLEDLPDRTFRTSGTTGTPATWSRTARQLVNEIEVVLERIGGDFDAVYSAVPPTSLYGYFFTVLAGARLGIPTHYTPWGRHRISANAARPLVSTIPIAWSCLPRRVDLAQSMPTFVHAGASLPTLAIDTVAALPNVGGFVEIFGATEVGAIATRPAEAGISNAAWQAFEDVELLEAPVDDDGEQALAIRSQRIGWCALSQPESIVLGDRVERLDASAFIFRGRRERVCKPGGTAIALDDYEATLRTALPVDDLACWPIVDATYGEHIKLAYIDKSNALAPADVRRLISRLHPPVAVVPREILKARKIHRSPMGKALNYER